MDTPILNSGCLFSKLVDQSRGPLFLRAVMREVGIDLTDLCGLQFLHEERTYRQVHPWYIGQTPPS
jgi:hypothetical protein